MSDFATQFAQLRSTFRPQLSANARKQLVVILCLYLSTAVIALFQLIYKAAISSNEDLWLFRFRQSTKGRYLLYNAMLIWLPSVCIFSAFCAASCLDVLLRQDGSHSQENYLLLTLLPFTPLIPASWMISSSLLFSGAEVTFQHGIVSVIHPIVWNILIHVVPLGTFAAVWVAGIIANLHWNKAVASAETLFSIISSGSLADPRLIMAGTELEKQARAAEKLGNIAANIWNVYAILYNLTYLPCAIVIVCRTWRKRSTGSYGFVQALLVSIAFWAMFTLAVSILLMTLSLGKRDDLSQSQRTILTLIIPNWIESLFPFTMSAILLIKLLVLERQKSLSSRTAATTKSVDKQVISPFATATAYEYKSSHTRGGTGSSLQSTLHWLAEQSSLDHGAAHRLQYHSDAVLCIKLEGSSFKDVKTERDHFRVRSLGSFDEEATDEDKAFVNRFVARDTSKE